MPNFTASVRTGIRDVQGLVLSCERADIEEDPTNPGHVLRWNNRAPGLPSKPAIRNPSDAITYAGGRDTSPLQLVHSLQPAIELSGGGQRRVRFTRSLGTHLSFTWPSTFPQVAAPATIAYEFEKRGVTTNNQFIYDDSQSQIVLRRRGSGGQAELKLGATTCTAAGDHIDGACIGASSGSAISWRRQNAPYATQGGASNPQVVAGSGYLGRGVGAGTELDGVLDSFHVWHRQLSPLEIDFVWQVLHADGGSFNSFPRARVRLKRWTDLTGVGGNGESNRIRSLMGAEPYFKLATVPNNGAAYVRVQIAAAVDGKVLPDASLGGNLFTVDWKEYPSLVPAVAQDAGWSSVFDCQLKHAGHYCAGVRRTGGGTVFLHFDVEVVP